MGEYHDYLGHFEQYPEDAERVLAEERARQIAERGEVLVRDVEAFINKYTFLPANSRLPVALWVIATHAFDLFDVFGYLALTSPTVRCGKTRLLEILELLAARPWRGTAPTEAALFRFIEAQQPTLLLDEVEGLSKPHASERDGALLAILNAGYKKGQTVPRCVGARHELQQFRVYCPKAFAAIRGLPPTLADRSIVVPMQRRSAGEPVARFRMNRAANEAAPIKRQIEQMVKALRSQIKETYAALFELPFLSDRDEEIFSPLFAVCGVLAPDRTQDLEESAKGLCDAKAANAVDDSQALRLLGDLKRLWPDHEVHWATAEIIEALKCDPESLWAAEMGLSPRRLARMLKPFEILPRDLRTAHGTRKGYIFGEVEVAHSRYIGSESETRATSRINTG